MPATGKQKARRHSSKQSNGILIISIVLVAVAFTALLIYAISQSNTQTASAAPGQYSDIPQTTTSDGAPILGNSSTNVMLMEVADFSCPHCLEYHPTILAIIDQYVRAGRVRLEYRPVTFVGGQFSDAAAQAALCAGKQNRFWEMEDALFNMQQTQGYQSFVAANLINTAQHLNLDGTAFARCLNTGETEKTIATTSDITSKLGVNGTPSLLYSTDGGQNFQFWPDPNTSDNKMRGGVTIDVVDNTIKSLGK